MIVCPDMSSKLRFQVHYGDGYISHDAYVVDLSAFERRECGIDKPLERSFGSIRKWFHEIFNVVGTLQLGYPLLLCQDSRSYP